MLLSHGGKIDYEDLIHGGLIAVRSPGAFQPLFTFVRLPRTHSIYAFSPPGNTVSGMNLDLTTPFIKQEVVGDGSPEVGATAFNPSGTGRKSNPERIKWASVVGTLPRGSPGPPGEGK